MKRAGRALGAALLAGCLPAAATTCSVAASAIAFGIYDTVPAVANDSTGLVEVVCTPGMSNPLTTPYVLTIAGTGSGNDSVRSIAAGAYRLYFQVYKDAGRTLVWGSGGSSGAGVASSVTSSAALVPALHQHTAYARMPAQQSVPPGSYTGQLLVTIDY